MVRENRAAVLIRTAAELRAQFRPLSFHQKSRMIFNWSIEQLQVGFALFRLSQLEVRERAIWSLRASE